MRDIVSGVVLIGIGFMFGGSIFLGDFSLINLLFDGLGTFFIVRGVLAMRKANQQSAAPVAAQRPPMPGRGSRPAAPASAATPAAPAAPAQRTGTR